MEENGIMQSCHVRKVVDRRDEVARKTRHAAYTLNYCINSHYIIIIRRRIC